MSNQIDDAIKFYEFLGQAEHKIGGRRKLGSLTGRHSLPQRGVYFFFEPNEEER